MSVKAKICGLTTPEAIDAASHHGAAMVGFIFFPGSPRYVTPQQAAQLAKNLSSVIQKVAVTVDATDATLDQIVKTLSPNILQLHGAETATRVAEIKKRYGKPVIKACAIAESDDVARAKAYQNVADILLLDTKPPKHLSNMMPGGNGLSFDWHLLQHHSFDKPWILSGGLSAHNVAEAVRVTGAKMVDVSSGVEIAPGKKDPKLIEEFLNIVKQIP